MPCRALHTAPGVLASAGMRSVRGIPAAPRSEAVPLGAPNRGCITPAPIGRLYGQLYTKCPGLPHLFRGTRKCLLTKQNKLKMVACFVQKQDSRIIKSPYTHHVQNPPFMENIKKLPKLYWIYEKHSNSRTQHEA